MTAATKSRLLSRDDILNVDDRRSEIVEVPEWGGSVRVQSLTGLERDQYETSALTWGKNDKGVPIVTGVNSDNMRARLVALSIRSEDGAPLFTERDVVALGTRSGSALKRVADVAQRLSGLTDADMEALKAGFLPVPSATSGSG